MIKSQMYWFFEMQ